MVTCSKCLHCFHSSCCNIDDETDIFVWKCHNCVAGEVQQNVSPNLNQESLTRDRSVEFIETPRTHPTESTTHHTTTVQKDISGRKLLLIQQLEEEMLLKQEFLRRKYEILRAEADKYHQVDNVRPEVNSYNNATTNNLPCVQSSQQDKNISRLQKIINPTINGNNGSNAILWEEKSNKNYNQLSQTQTNCNADHTLNIPNYNDFRQQKQSTRDCQNTHLFSESCNKNNNQSETTMSQILARSYISKDLPAFNGDPKEWPIFISAYENSNRVAGFTNEENLIRLQKCLHGKAREAVRNCLMLPDMVPDIIRTLKMYYGRPECIIKNLIDEVRKCTLHRGKLDTLIEFAFTVKNLCATIRASQLEEYLINPTLLQELVDKLPTDTVLQWALYSKDIPRPNLMDFSNWLYSIAEATCKVTVPIFDSSLDKKTSKKEGRLNTHTTRNVQQLCVICDEPHKLAQCLKFKNMCVTERWNVVKSKNLCRICLGKHRRRCWFQKQCGVDGCSVLHNALLHNDEQAVGGKVNNHRSSVEGESYYRIVPVTLYGDKKSIKIYALLDDGSTLTLVEEKIADSLGVKGINDPLCIQWTGNVTRYENDSKRLNLKISSSKPNAKKFPLSNVHTVKKLNLSNETLNVESVKSKYAYLKNIPLEGYENVVPSMIIGVNNPNLISSIKVCEGGWHQPVASKTRLGWTLFGGGSKANGKLNFHRYRCEEIHGLVKQFFSDESVGIASNEKIVESKEDQQALDILNNTCTLNNGRYEVGLLWKTDPPELPNSLPMALKRLKCIKQKAEKDTNSAQHLQQQIANLREKGYAKRLPLAVLKENKAKTWYLPTFIVKNPQKPNKIRLVWDAAAKSKVAPLRPLSIPRLELQAATIGARLMNTVSSHNIKFQQKFMWTDSKTVLAWINGDPRKYKQFVMFRVAEILNYTTSANWRWVPSALNVADFATKFRPANKSYKEWFEGPSWLKLPESQWPKSLDTPYHLDASEIRPRYLNIHFQKSNIISINFEYFSSWYRLIRAVAMWVLFVERKYQILHRQKYAEKLNASHLNKAKKIILKTTQMTSFADEYAAIQSGRPCAKGGAFNKLKVYIDEDGIVRVKNRAQYATTACGPQRDLIILPAKHHLTRLLVMNYHRSFHHLNHETVLNEIRQIYYIPKLRVVYKAVRRSCQQCKIDFAKPVQPQMAPLPPARLAAFQRPFTFVGVDYFGPISVVFGRRSLKRWGVIFTCLTVRAIHIEIAHSLSTDSFLMTLKNFIARRGVPAEIYSDNGTNFRGADRFLKYELRHIKFDDVQTEMAYRGISWKFNPPAAPHMGGAWERLVRSIKTILYKIVPSQKFTDESLRSALMEVELTINSRPLTYVSLEVEDQEAITPNHFLLGSSNGSKPLCSLETFNHKMCLRQSEVFANLFWRRFVKEMLPTLTRRSKWTQKCKAIEVGDIVLVIDENADRNSWLKGKIIEVTKAKDGQVRRAKVKTQNGILERPAVKLAVLDVGNALE